MDPRQVLVDGLGDFFNEGLFSGVGSMGVWRHKFTRMQREEPSRNFAIGGSASNPASKIHLETDRSH